MSATPRKGFNKRPKSEADKLKYSKKYSNSKDSNDGSERTEKRRPRNNVRDGVDGNDSSDLKRKRVHAEKGGEFKRKGKEEGFKKKGSVKKDDVSEFDRQNRVKFSSRKDGDRGDRGGYKGRGGGLDGRKGIRRDGNVERRGVEGFESWKGYKGGDGTFNSRSIQRDGFNEERSRKKEFGSSRGYKGGDGNFDGKSSFSRGREEDVDRKGNSNYKGKNSVSRGKERMGREEDIGRRRISKGKTRERPVSSKRDVDDDGFDTDFKSQPRTRGRRSSDQQDDVSDSKFNVEGRGVSNRQDDSQKQDSKKKTDSSRQLPQKASNSGESGELEKSMKKQVRPKKYAKEDSSEDGPPKKKVKKAMRIAPNDISNKKIDDGITFDAEAIENMRKAGYHIELSGKAIEKTVDPDEKNEMSMNAQFRAIQPTPSILSFVEENLLGRRRSIDLRRAGYNIELSAPLDNIPLSTSTERERIEEAVFRNKLEFFAAAKVASSFPPAELPEIAFAGRSNVGKSSLLNALTRQWGVVRTSDKPGLTQTINFFKLGSKLSMVDLPGYGFAYAKEEVKDAWEELVKEYVSTRVGLKRVCLLIDTKWGMKPRDHELINLMERSQTKYQIVLTKSDLVFPMDVARRAMQIEDTLKAHKSVVQPVMMISSKTGGGIRSLRTVLAQLARIVK